ncbi:hypothetical protein B0T10DRAFT_194302 [Thelonectria olida]|uniref:AB hydrolase-1 domain-containing protein n=1 Tax=Thelonectria olida TaxID=1576542 RepID=A0A9P9AKC1_9HYPO|nr:hypothetical protein B0T10DRAFT_194302 [Thelonectria olida]
MIGTSLPEWIFIRIAIFLLQYTPLIYAVSLVNLFLVYRSQAFSLLITQVLNTALLAELVFFLLIYRPFLRRLKQNAQHPEPLLPPERKALFHKCMANIHSAEMYLQGWFLGAPRDEIRRENVKEFLLWGFFERGSDGTFDDEEAISQELDEYIALLEEHLGSPLKEGRGNAQSLRLTFDEIKSVYRSLAWYIIIFFVDQATHLAMMYHGFQYHRRSRANALRIFPPRPQELVKGRYSPSPELSYWHRQHSAPDKLPVVFFHGIGVGLWTYVRFIANLASNKNEQGNIGVIAIEILPISFRLGAPIPTKAEFVTQITTIIDHHCWQDFAVASHSYGSVLTTHMLHTPHLQHRISSVALIDPVTITLQLPHVAYNFTRRLPKRANEWLLWYFASTDPGVALCLGRHFFWRENILWKDDLLVSETDGRKMERKVVVSLAGRDLIVDTAIVLDYLGGTERNVQDPSVDGHENLKVVMHPSLDHAQLFDDAAASGSMVRMVRSNCGIESSVS